MYPENILERLSITAGVQSEASPLRAPPDRTEIGLSWGRGIKQDTGGGSKVPTEVIDPNMSTGHPQIGHSQGRVVLINSHTIIRECLAQAMRSWTYEVETLPSVEGCVDLISRHACDLIILWGGSHLDLAADLDFLRGACRSCPILVICDTVGAETVIKVLESGARGILPTSSKLDILNGVMSLIRSGGAYVPPDSMIEAYRAEPTVSVQPSIDLPFTPRQSAIIAAIRKGSPNKIIAYDLGMCESTVKVHIRSIMKKLKVRNRTELALKAMDLRI